ncbi:MAG: c-type cytochrome, partial [Candidatus Puniceispirillaceae bacterium]
VYTAAQIKEFLFSVERDNFMKSIKAKLAVVVAVFLASGAAQAGDAEKGKKVFKKCAACHLVDKEKHKTGPHLVNLFGREAGSLESYKKYSKAMKASGIVWNAETLDGYLAAPKKYLKGTKMAFAGLKKEADRQNIIAYLESLQ